MDGLTREQMRQQDKVDNYIRTMLSDLSGRPEESFSLADITSIRLSIQELYEDNGIMSPMEFYPYLDENEEPDWKQQ